MQNAIESLHIRCVWFVSVEQKGYMCGVFDKSPDLFGDSLKDLVYERVGRSERRLKAIEE